jgi:hypothetical protein
MVAIKSARNFSQDLKDQSDAADQIEAVRHPLVKQIITQVLAEGSIDTPQGSAFGEGGGAG